VVREQSEGPPGGDVVVVIVGLDAEHTLGREDLLTEALAALDRVGMRHGVEHIRPAPVAIILR